MIRHIAIAALSYVLLGSGLIQAQDAPTADQVKQAIAAFKTEREEAAKSFGKAELASADELADKADKALAVGNTTAALRLAGEARWQIPFVPTGLPEHVIRVLGAGRLRHGDRVNAIAYSPDSTKLVSASRDGTVRIWDVGNGRELVVYRGHLDTKPPKDTKEMSNVLNVAGVAYSPDGEWIASCSGPEIHVWEAKTGKRVHTLKGFKGPYKSLAFGKDKKMLVSGGDDKKLVVWDVAGEKATYTSEDQSLPLNAVAVSPTDSHVASVNQAGEMVIYQLGMPTKLALSLSVSDEGRGVQCLAFSRDGTGVFTGGNDRKAKLSMGAERIGGQEPGSTVRKFEGHTDPVNALALSPDGKTLVTGSNDRSVIVWDTATGKIMRVFQGHLKEVTSVAVRPDGRQIASASEDGTMRLWSLTTADEHRSFTEAGDNLWTVAFSPNGKQFASAGADRTIRVYDSTTGKLEKSLTGHKGPVTAILFIDEGHIASASGDKLVKIWDVAAGTAKDCTGHTSAVLALHVANKVLVSGSTDKTVRAWDPIAGTALWTWTGKSAVCAVAIRKDDQRVAVGCADGKLTMLQVAGKDPQILGEVNAHTSGVSALAFARDEYRVASCGGDGLAKLWNTTTGIPVAITKFDAPIRGSSTGVSPVTAIAFSNDDKVLVGGGAEGVVRLWDVGTGSEIRVLRGHTGWVTSLAFSADNRSVLSCAVDRTVRLFEIPRSETTASGHVGQARCITVSRDGKYAATGSEDKTVKVWELATGREMITLSGIEGHVTAVVFVGDDKIAAGGQGNKLKVWDFKTGKELRSLSAEMAFYLSASENGDKIGMAWANNTKDGGFHVYSPDKDAPTTTKGGKITAAALSPDAAWGVTGSEDGIIRIWDLAKSDRLGGDWPIMKNSVADIGMTPDRKTVVVVDDKGEVRVADVAKREVVTTANAVNGGVNGVLVSPVGEKFATLNATGEVRVFDFKGKELRKWNLSFAANAAVFTMDGKRLLTANADGTIYVLELP